MIYRSKQCNNRVFFASSRVAGKNLQDNSHIATKEQRKMTKYISKLGFALCVILSVLGLVSTTSFADATTPATITNENVSYSPLAVENQQTVSIDATINGKLEVKAEMPKAKQPKGKLTCRTGEAIWGASTTSSGKTVWIPSPGHHGIVHACLVKGVWRQMRGDPKKQWNCGNRIVWMHHQLPKGAVKYTGKWIAVTHFTFNAKVKAKAHVAATLTATASCTSSPGNYAGGSGSVSGDGYALVTFSASGSSRAKAIAKASAGLTKVSQSQDVMLKGEAKADAKLNLSAAAWARCSSTPTPPTCEQTGTCPPPPTCEQTGTCPKQSIKITSNPSENDIPEGKNSGQLYLTVNASDAGGSVTIDPGIGGVSACDSTTSGDALVFSDLGSGITRVCYILYAPGESGADFMTATYTAILGSASDTKSDTFRVTHPTRPEAAKAHEFKLAA